MEDQASKHVGTWKIDKVELHEKWEQSKVNMNLANLQDSGIKVQSQHLWDCTCPD